MQHTIPWNFNENRFGGVWSSATTQDTVWLTLPCAAASARSQGIKAPSEVLQYQTDLVSVHGFFTLFPGTCLWTMLCSLFICMRTAVLANDSSMLPGSSLETVLAHNSKIDDGVKQEKLWELFPLTPKFKNVISPRRTWKIPRGPRAPWGSSPERCTLISEHGCPLWSILAGNNSQ